LQSTVHSLPLTIHDEMPSQQSLLSSVAFLLLISAFAHSQSYCAPIKSAKEKTYGFNPTKLDHQARTAKSAQMDAFWTLVKSYEGDGVTCLRGLLTSEKDDGFFLFDGASLLYSLDKSDASTRVVVSSIERADLDEVDTRGYLQLLLKLSKAGIDVGPLANRHLTRKDANARCQSMRWNSTATWAGCLSMEACPPTQPITTSSPPWRTKSPTPARLPLCWQRI
jgi:hypothetical protein